MWQAANMNLFTHFFIQYLFNIFYEPVTVLGVPFTVQTVKSPCSQEVYSLVTPFSQGICLSIL